MTIRIEFSPIRTELPARVWPGWHLSEGKLWCEDGPLDEAKVAPMRLYYESLYRRYAG